MGDGDNGTVINPARCCPHFRYSILEGATILPHYRRLHMIFSENPDDFRYGRWVGNLNHELARSRLREHLKEKRDVDVIPDSNWYRRPRFWRATGEQWLQFERKDLGLKYPDDDRFGILLERQTGCSAVTIRPVRRLLR